MSDMLQIRQGVGHMDDIKDMQLHTYTPYTSSFKNNDEIRISIQSSDLCVLPSESYILLEFKPHKRQEFIEAVAATQQNPENHHHEPIFSRLSGLHFFSEIRYEINGVEVDRCKLPHITHELKTMMACKMSDSSSLSSMTWLNNSLVHVGKTYRLTIPLKFLFGFCEDYQKVLVNGKHDLILIRDSSDSNVYIAPEDSLAFEIERIHWKIPHIVLSDHAKMQMQRTIDSKKILPLPFRSWDLYELPNLPQTTRNIWSVKTTTHTTKPRYVVVALQTNRNHVIQDNPRKLDHCDLMNVRLYLNNVRYPYDDMNLNFAQNNGNFNEMFNVLNNIQNQYYNGTESSSPVDLHMLLKEQKVMFFVFDCSRSDESIKNGMIDVRIELDARTNFPPLTTAYCLIIHDNLLHYCPATGIVHRDITA